MEGTSNVRLIVPVPVPVFAVSHGKTESTSNQEADAFYLHRDLLFQTARTLNEYLDIKSERMAYTALVRDIRFCQNTYLKPRIGAKLLKAVLDYANEQTHPQPLPAREGSGYTASDTPSTSGEELSTPLSDREGQGVGLILEELLGLLRQALAFYVESRRTTITQTSLLSGTGTYATASSQKDVKLARRDSMTDAQQAMAMACDYIEQNLDALGEAAIDTPIYIKVKQQEAQAE